MFEREPSYFEIFHDMTDSELGPLMELFDEVRLPANHVVFRQGDFAEAFYMIKEGTVVLFRDGGADEPVQLLARLGPGDHFGEFGIYDELICSASARTSEPGRILRIGKRALMDVLVEHPTVALRMQRPRGGPLQSAATREHGSAPASGLASRREVRTIIDKDLVLMLEDGTSMKVRFLNLSRGGLCFRGVPPDWEAGRRVRFHVGLGTGMLQLGGDVSWIRDDAVGVAFSQRSQGHNMKVQWALRQLVVQKGQAMAHERTPEPLFYAVGYGA